MSLYDGYTEKQNDVKSKKMKKLILTAIIIICLLIVILIGLIMYISGRPSSISIQIDGKVNDELLKLIKIKENESGTIELNEEGKPILYAPIKKLAKTFGYIDNNGNYIIKSEDTDSCNVKNENEVAIFTLDSNIVYKKDLKKQGSNYETYKINEKVFKDIYTEKNEQTEELYTDTEGIELAFNIDISYDSKTNSINIFTLDYLVSYYTTEDPTEEITPIEKLGYSELDASFVNHKAILDNMLVVKNEQGDYGVVNLKGKGSVQYDSVTYIPEIKSFLVESDGKYGIMSAKEETLATTIDTVYNSIELIDSDKQLYLVSENTKYGIIDINSNIIIPIEYSKVGIDINQFAENNINNEYILQEKLIPVQQGQKWGLYDLNRNLVGEGIVYDAIGCITKNSQGTSYSVLSIPEYNLIIVKKDGKYGCINLEGEVIIPCIADDVYMQISSGKTKYIMSQTVNEQVYTKDIADIIKTNQ